MTFDATDPEQVAKKLVECVIARDYTGYEALVAISEKEKAELAEQGTTYTELLELLWGYPDEEAGSDKPLPERVKELYTGTLEMHVGEVPRQGKIAAGVIGPADPDGERVLVVILFPQPDGSWRALEPPKSLPAAKIRQIG